MSKIKTNPIRIILMVLISCELTIVQSIDLVRKKHKFTVSPSTGPKSEIAVIVIVNEDPFGYKKFSNAINKELDLISENQEKYPITRQYRFKPYIKPLQRGAYPLEIVQYLCNVTQYAPIAYIYLTSNERFDKSTEQVQYLVDVNRYTGIPIVAWNTDNAGVLAGQNFNDFLFVQLAPPIEHQLSAMLALVQRYNWHKIGVITSDIAGSATFARLVRAHEKDAAEDEDKFQLKVLVIRRLTRVIKDQSEGWQSDANKTMKQLAQHDARIFLIYATKAETVEILKMADLYGLNGSSYLWIVTQSSVTNVMEVPEAYKMGMLAVHFNTEAHNFDPDRNVLIPALRNAIKVVASGASRIHERTPQFSFRSKFSCAKREDFRWYPGRKVYDFMRNVTLTPDEDDDDQFEISFTKRGKLKNSHLEILNLKSDGEWHKVGDYSNALGVKLEEITWPHDKPQPPAGTPDRFHLRVVSLEEPPFVVVSNKDPLTNRCAPRQAKCQWVDGPNRNESTEKCCTGYCIDLLDKLSKDVGFTYDLYRVPDGLWGIKTRNEWNGLIKDLVDHKADLCATSLKINSARATDIDFSVPFLKTGIAIMVKIRKGALSPVAFLEPFEYNTWVLILIVSIQGAAIAMFFFEWVSPDGYNMQNRPVRGHTFSLMRALWLVWATLFSASVNTDVPRSIVARLMALIWAAFALTFLAVYTANLAAFMITQTEYYNLQGINDPYLLNPKLLSPPFTYGTVNGGNTHQTLKRNYKKVYNYIHQNNLYQKNVLSGVTAIKEDKLDAFIYDAVVLDYLAGKDGQWFSKTGYAFGFTKNSIHQEKINEMILTYQKKGDLERLQSFWLTGACKGQAKSRKTQSDPLGIENFISAFMLLAGGIAIGMLILIIEHIYCKYLRDVTRRSRFSSWCNLLSMSVGRSLTFTDNPVDETDSNNVGLAEDSQTNQYNTQTFKLTHSVYKFFYCFRCRDVNVHRQLLAAQKEIGRLRHQLDVMQVVHKSATPQHQATSVWYESKEKD